MSKAVSPSEAKKMSLEDALAAFSDLETTPDIRRAALTVLITEKHLPKNADEHQVLSGRAHLIEAARNAADPRHKLLAIAEAMRLVQMVKRWLPDVKKQLEPVFLEMLPPAQLLDEADDRLNLARACALYRPDWMPEYLARSIAEEETGEKARSEMLDALMSRVSSLSAALQLLALHFKELRPATEIPGDTIARRLTRTLAALRTSVLETELDAGDCLGKSLHGLLSVSFSAVGKPQDEKAKLEFARETLLTVHDLVRTRISVVADPEMYGAVSYSRQLLGGGAWPAPLQKPLDSLITDVTEALVLLGRQGQCDQALLEQLNVLCNYPERAQFVAKDLAARHAELPENVRDWLIKGRMRQVRDASEAAIEAAASNADASIGLALQSARLARQLGDGLRDKLISSLEIYEPSLVSPTQECLDRAKALAIQVEQAASLRNLDLLGQPGEEIEMSAKFFEVVSGNPRQRMVVRQPAVVKMREDGTVGDVVLKGLVE